VFLAVPTPEGPGGEVDLSFVLAALRSVAAVVSPPTPVVIKSSVPPGTAARLGPALRAMGCGAPLVINPEFLQEGRAVQDVLHPYRVVVGSDDPQAAALVAELHLPFAAPVVVTGAASAELAKYAANAYLATRLTFVNAVAHLAEDVGADAEDVLRALALDPRVGPHYLRPGPGYGGSCFPKDVRALVAAGAAHGHDLKLLRAVVETNDDQLARVAAKVEAAAGGLRGKVIGLLGLAFKGGTADTRSSPAVALARRLAAAGARVQAYDPAARVDLAGVEQVPDALAAAAGADVVLVATEWPEFAALDPAELGAVMRGRVVVDARNLLDRDAVVEAGLDYRGLGR
jgi:UDPglucose 6-dehydrogenase